MDDVAAVRRAALAAVDDVEPDRLHERIDARLDDASLAPGVRRSLARAQPATHRLTWLTASPTEPPASAELEGLSLTANGKRLLEAGYHDVYPYFNSSGHPRLAWLDCSPEPKPPMLPSLSSVRSATTRPSVDDRRESLDTARTDILELAVVAGVTAAGIRPTPTLREYATELATDGLPPNAELLGEEVADALRARAGAEQPSGDGTEAAADH